MQIIFLKIRLNNNLNKQSLELFSYLHSLQKNCLEKHTFQILTIPSTPSAVLATYT